MMLALLIFGTQAELTKTVGLISAVPAGIELDVLWTGQHRDLVPAAAADLRAMETIANHLQARTGGGDLRAAVETARPDVVIVQGDTRSALEGAVAAKETGVPLVHLEAGLRLSGILEPEEDIRRRISRLASYHVAADRPSSIRLIAEGVDPRCIQTCAPLAAIYLGYLTSIEDGHAPLPDAPYIVTTIHRASALENQLEIAQLLVGLADLITDRLILLVRRPDPRWTALFDHLDAHPSIDAIDSVPPAGFSRLLRGAEAVITDSAGVQQECSILGIPHVVLRSESEMPGAAPHIGSHDADEVFAAIKETVNETRPHGRSSVAESWEADARSVWEAIAQWIV